VIEAKLDRGRGPVATVLVQDGTLRVGEPIICGSISGKVRAMISDKGERIAEAGPSTPVEVLGLNDVPMAGDRFQVVSDDRVARQVAEKRSWKIKEATQRTQRITLDDLFKQIQEGEVQDLNLIIKGDVQGSVEALQEALLKQSLEEVKIKVIHTGVGSINESDVMLASASNAIVIGFNVRPDTNARKLSEQDRVDIRLYRIIYEVIDDIKAAVTGLLKPEFKEIVLGQAQVRQVFKASKLGSIAGCHVTEGKISRNASVRLIRDGVVVHEGRLASLKRFKDDTREVLSGFECGILLENYNDVHEGDIIEAFTMEQIIR
jgi:translation initiation factor IF-2